MKLNKKRIIITLLSFSLIFSLAGCAKKEEKKYQEYVRSLISINYLGASDDYLKKSGANKADAEALYEENIDLLTDEIIDYYGLRLGGNTDIRDDFKAISRKIYQKANYEVDRARLEDGTYKVDVRIRPISLFAQVEDEIISYTDSFNERINKGEFNNSTSDEYQTEFCGGLIEILSKGADNITYAPEVTVTVSIIEDGSKYYISDDDLLAIDRLMITTDSHTASDTDAK